MTITGMLQVPTAGLVGSWQLTFADQALPSTVLNNDMIVPVFAIVLIQLAVCSGRDSV